jgi:hypothetical protein
VSAPTNWTTSALTADLAAKLRADQYLVVAEVTLRPSTLQRADLLAMRRKLAHGPMMVVEIKTGRADLIGDLKREKWRGYLDDGAVVFAFPAGLALPGEIPTEAGVMVRVAQGWSWKRAPRWSEAPLPTPYLYRRMALSASDQSAAKVRADMTPKAADLWRAARGAKQQNGRRLAEIAADVDTWRRIVADDRAEFDRLHVAKRALEQEVRGLQALRGRLQREAAA